LPYEPLLYHGGPPGLTRIEPRAKTGAESVTTCNDWRQFFLSPYRVYMTEEYKLAATCAAAWAARTHNRAGCVYIVRPGADLDIDVDEARCWSADSAEVVEVVGPVRASRLRELRAWYERWSPAQPFPVASWDEWLALRDRAAQRAVKNGWDEATVTALLNDAPGASELSAHAPL
jgi:hypothetical protein